MEFSQATYRSTPPPFLGAAVRPAGRRQVLQADKATTPHRLPGGFRFRAWTHGLVTFLLMSGGALGGDGPVPRLKIQVVATYPHDTSSFTQGLVWDGGTVLESTGRYGYSRIRRLRLESGQVLLERQLPWKFFGEGLAIVGDRLVQLTWREETALIYDLRTFEEVGRVGYQGEGWGLTFDGSWLIMSDGSQTLTFRDPKTFAVWRRLPVRLEGRPVDRLNELEFADGFVYANVWQSTDILKIDPASGQVTAILDASALPYRQRSEGEDVLNGIAWIPERKTFLLTGKLWPNIFEVRVE